MNGVLPFVVRRLLAAIPVLIAVTAATFFLGRFAPGDPITIRTGGRASPEVVDRIKHQLHLDQNPAIQYVRYMGNLVTGDFGESYRHPGVKVSTLILPKIKVSLEENIYPFILTFLIGLPIGIYLALHRGAWQDPSITALLLFLSAIPVVLLIPVLQYVFALKLGWLPAAGWHGLFAKTIILPTVVLTVPGLAGIARLMRISLVQVMDDEYVRTARSKGLSEAVVVYRHMLRNGLLPIVTAVITSLFFLFVGSFFVELLFGIPGIGNETISALGSRDYDEFMALTVLGAVAFIFANIVVDITYSLIDPRIRLGTGRQ
jgi:ABC-type dipeptide/oligopeptide/nickel transport system permease component